jgi:hypothetical protein
MSSTRTLTDKIAWTDDMRAIELLDWETRPEDFDRLCEFIIAKFAERDGVTRERLFSVLPEEEFRRQLRVCAERFTERFQSLVIFVYLRMKQLVLPEAVRQKRERQV